MTTPLTEAITTVSEPLSAASVYPGGHFVSVTGCAVMNLWETFPLVCGYEVIGDQVRLYLDSPTPVPDFTRERGVRSPLFRLYSGRDAEAVVEWLAKNRAWQVLRVAPPFTPELGVRAVLTASEWHGGEGSALCGFARTRVVADDAHRGRMRREVRHLIGMVLENPVRDGEFDQLQTLEDAINAAPLGVELATTGEVVDRFFGGAG